MKKTGIVLTTVGTVVGLVAGVMAQDPHCPVATALLVMLVGGVLMGSGGWIWARAKGYHGAVGLFGLLGVFGMLILGVLPDKSEVKPPLGE